MQRQMQNPLERLQWLFSPHFEGAAQDRDAARDSLISQANRAILCGTVMAVGQYCTESLEIFFSFNLILKITSLKLTFQEIAYWSLQKI
jgi:hypothetical protein